MFDKDGSVRVNQRQDREKEPKGCWQHFSNGIRCKKLQLTSRIRVLLWPGDFQPSGWRRKPRIRDMTASSTSRPHFASSSSTPSSWPSYASVSFYCSSHWEDNVLERWTSFSNIRHDQYDYVLLHSGYERAVSRCERRNGCRTTKFPNYQSHGSHLGRTFADAFCLRTYFIKRS